MLSELTECTILMLKVIHDMYLSRRISLEEFIKYTELKIQFLSENIDKFSSEADKEKAYDIINKCNSLIMKKTGHTNYLQ